MQASWEFYRNNCSLCKAQPYVRMLDYVNVQLKSDDRSRHFLSTRVALQKLIHAQLTAIDGRAALIFKTRA